MSEDSEAVLHDLTIHCYKEFSYLKQELQKIKEKSVTDNENKVDRREFDQYKSFCETLLNSQKSELGHLAIELEKHKNLCKNYQEMLDKFFSENEKNKNDLQEISSKFPELRNEFVKSISVCKSWTIDLIDKKASEIKVSIFPKANTEDLGLLKNEIISKLELVELNGTNSTLRSQNADQQIKILEKKIENIYLILKKHELSVV